MFVKLEVETKGTWANVGIIVSVEPDIIPTSTCLDSVIAEYPIVPAIPVVIRSPHRRWFKARVALYRFGKIHVRA